MKAAIFIDGWHLKKREEDNKIKLDYHKLSDELTKGDYRVRTNYYAARAKPEDLVTKELKELDLITETFHCALDRFPRFAIRLGRLEKIAGKWKQKGVDMRLGVDMVQMSANKLIDKAILIAADGDFVYAVEKAKDAGIVTSLITFPVDAINRDLRRAVDEVVELDKATFEKCKLN